MKKIKIILILLFSLLFLQMECQDEKELAAENELTEVKINLMEWETLGYPNGASIDIKYNGGFTSGRDVGWFSCRYEGKEDMFFAYEEYVYNYKDIKLKVKDVEFNYAILCLNKKSTEEQEKEPLAQTPAPVADRVEQEKNHPTGEQKFNFNALGLKKGDTLFIGEITALYTFGTNEYTLRLVGFSDSYTCVDENFLSNYKDNYANKTFVVLVRNKEAIKVMPFDENQ